MEMHILRLTQTLQVTSSILVQVLHVCHMDPRVRLSSGLSFVWAGSHQRPAEDNVLENRKCRQKRTDGVST